MYRQFIKRQETFQRFIQLHIKKLFKDELTITAFDHEKRRKRNEIDNFDVKENNQFSSEKALQKRQVRYLNETLTHVNYDSEFSRLYKIMFNC